MASFRYCFNTSTIRGQKLSLVEEIDIAAQVGYQAIEPWIGEIETYVRQGGSLADLKKRISDRGLTVESAIGFAEWIVDDDARRTKGLEQARRDMDLVQQIGGKRIAAPPAGATDVADIDYLKVAERYRALLTLGDHIGVVPQVEVWGFSKTLNRLGQAVLVAIESGHPQACVLPDVYHLVQGRLRLRRPQPAQRHGDACVSHERLSGHSASASNQRQRPRLSRRRRSPARRHPSNVARRSISMATCRSSCSTRRIGSKIRWKWPAWR